MKKTNLNGKLSLRKETISELSNPEMKAVNGGLFKSKFLCRRSYFATDCMRPTWNCETRICDQKRRYEQA